VQGSNLATSNYSGFGNAVRTIINAQGISGLYKGAAATFFYELPLNGTWWMVYDFARKHVRTKVRESKKVSVIFSVPKVFWWIQQIVFWHRTSRAIVLWNASWLLQCHSFKSQFGTTRFQQSSRRGTLWTVSTIHNQSASLAQSNYLLNSDSLSTFQSKVREGFNQTFDHRTNLDQRTTEFSYVCTQDALRPDKPKDDWPLHDQKILNKGPHPIDVVKTHIQVKQTTVQQKQSFLDTAKHLYRIEGAKHLCFKGVTPRLFMMLPFSALGIAGYEACKTFAMIQEEQ